MSIAQTYVRKVKRELHDHFAAWTPDRTIHLGDVGVIKKKVFYPLTSLSDLKIPFETREDTTPSPLLLGTESEFSMTVKGEGETRADLPGVPEAKAGISLTFAREGAFVFAANKVYWNTIKPTLELRDAILEAFEVGNWDKNWRVMMNLALVPKATIIVAASNGATIDLTAEGKLGGKVLTLSSLADAKLGFKGSIRKGKIWHQLNALDITPFFQVYRMKRHVLAPMTKELYRYGLEPIDPMAEITPKMLRDNPTLRDQVLFDLEQDGIVEEVPVVATPSVAVAA